MFLTVWRREAGLLFLFLRLYLVQSCLLRMLADVYPSSVGTMAQYGLFLFVELVTVAKLVVSAPPRSLQSAEPSPGLPTPAII